MPESRSELRPRLDVAGVLLSSAGLGGLTYGFIRAGETSWTNTSALATIAAGVVVLAGLRGLGAMADPARRRGVKSGR